MPGVAPHDYIYNEAIELLVEKLDSAKTQLPYEYYYLNYCPPPEKLIKDENIGQELVGDIIESSPYVINMNVTTKCKVLCKMENNDDHLKNFRWMIDYQYRASWVLDSLPAGFHKTIISENNTQNEISIYQDGFPVGFKYQGEYYINNHHNIIIEIYPTVIEGEPITFRIVGFLVEPLSINNDGHLACEGVSFNDVYFNKHTTTKITSSAEIEINTDTISDVYGIKMQ